MARNILRFSDTLEKQEYEKSVLESEDVKYAMDYHHRMGFTEGMERERKEGQEEDKKQARQELIANMLGMGISIADMAKTTGMSEEELRLLFRLQWCEAQKRSALIAHTTDREPFVLVPVEAVPKYVLVTIINHSVVCVVDTAMRSTPK